MTQRDDVVAALDALTPEERARTRRAVHAIEPSLRPDERLSTIEITNETLTFVTDMRRLQATVRGFIFGETWLIELPAEVHRKRLDDPLHEQLDQLIVL